VLSIHRLSAGDGYRYLLRHTAAGDIDRPAASTLKSYYAASGYPPGRWLGSGLAGVAGGRLTPGADVTEAQMANLYGRGLDPVTGAALGRPYPVYRTRAQRVADRTARLDDSLSPQQRAAAVSRIEAEEGRRRTPCAVAGFDLTFSPVKSVSSLWAIANAQTQAEITAAHHEALDDVLAVMEREAAFTRTGAGGVAQLDTRGLIAAAFDHWDTRAGDPQLHTHLVIANRVQGPDGRWRTLDGRTLYAATVALSETYNTLLADHLTARLGVDWEHRERGRDRNSAFEISHVPQALLAEFSARTTQIEHHLCELVTEHRQRTGREPSRRDVYVLRQQATLLERPAKDTPKPLTELIGDWRTRAEHVLGTDP
jgi:conjugative relaxase-like TrwC/TraI family protein